MAQSALDRNQPSALYGHPINKDTFYVPLSVLINGV